MKKQTHNAITGETVEVEMTAEETTAHNSAVETANAQWQVIKDAKAQEDTDKASAKAKLIAGEALTEAEADTIVI